MLGQNNNSVSHKALGCRANTVVALVQTGMWEVVTFTWCVLTLWAGGYKSEAWKEPKVREKRSEAIRNEVVGLVVKGSEFILGKCIDSEGKLGLCWADHCNKNNDHCRIFMQTFLNRLFLEDSAGVYSSPYPSTEHSICTTWYVSEEGNCCWRTLQAMFKGRTTV